MAKQEGHLIDRNPGQQHLDGKRVAKHVGVASLSLAIGCSDIRHIEETAVASLPIGDSAFGIAIATPEEVAGIGLRAWRKIFERFDDLGWKRNMNRLGPSLRK